MKEANGTKEYQMRQSYGEKKCFCINLPERLPVQGMFTCEYFCMTLDGPLFFTNMVHKVFSGRMGSIKGFCQRPAWNVSSNQATALDSLL